MQVATLSYHYTPKDQRQNGSRNKAQRRHVLTTVTNPTTKKSKSQEQRTFHPDLSTYSTNSLPAINKTSKRPSSIRIKGNGLQSSKLTDASISSFHQPSRSRSRQSDKSDVVGSRSQSITPSAGGGERSSSKLVRLRFGYPVKFRSANFYGPNQSDSELRSRENSFVNDSIRTANQRTRSSNASYYDALNDPHLQEFFESPVVLDVVRRTLNVNLEGTATGKKKRSKRSDSNGGYQGIVAKHSSGYGKLNGYDCLPPFVPGRHRRSLTQGRYQSSANTSLTSFPTYNSLNNPEKRKSRSKQRSKQLTPIATSSPVRPPVSRTDANETDV